jgi:hypothetical protein
LALGAVMPQRYDYREARLDEMKAAYQKIVAHKSAWLRSATIFFGLGLAAFALLIVGMLVARL